MRCTTPLYAYRNCNTDKNDKNDKNDEEYTADNKTHKSAGTVTYSKYNNPYLKNTQFRINIPESAVSDE